MVRETWEVLLLFLLRINDTLLAPPTVGGRSSHASLSVFILSALIFNDVSNALLRPPLPAFSWGCREAGGEINGGAVRGVATGLRPLLPHAAVLEDGEGDAGQLETPPACR